MLLFLPAYFLVVLLMISSSFVRIVTALVPCVCVCFFFFSCRSQRRCQAARETSRCRVGEQERAVAMPFGPASNGLSVVG